MQRTTRIRPPNAANRSARTLAKELGVSYSVVHRVWPAKQLRPHLDRTFKLSTGPHFVERVQDVVGLHPNHLEHALVLGR